MPHALSAADRQFLADVQTGRLPTEQFDHRAHLRLAYGTLVGQNTEAGVASVRATLQGYLAHHGVPPGKYHETLTQAWTRAVGVFLARSEPCVSAEAFLTANPRLLDPGILLTHYSKARLFSDEARARYVTADLDPIPAT